MPARGIKGATTTSENSETAILEAASELVVELLQANAIRAEEIAAVFFSCTSDLNATFPARAARQLGLTQVPLLCSEEMDVPGALPRCIRVTLLVNSELAQAAMRHLYLRGAGSLRPEFAATASGKGAG